MRTTLYATLAASAALVLSASPAAASEWVIKNGGLKTTANGVEASMDYLKLPGEGGESHHGGVSRGGLALNNGSLRWKVETMGRDSKPLKDLDAKSTSVMLKLGSALFPIVKDIWNSASESQFARTFFRIQPGSRRGGWLTVEIDHPDFKGVTKARWAHGKVTLSPRLPRWTVFRGVQLKQNFRRPLPTQRRGQL